MSKKYYITLINRIWKILPIYEENQTNFYKYSKSIYLELKGNEDKYVEIEIIRNKINGLIEEDRFKIDHTIVRSTILECISVLDRMITLIELE